MNTGKELSLRQVLAAVTLAGLSLAASQAGVVDWAWGLVGTAAAAPLLRWLMLRQGDKPLCRGGYGVVLRGLYCLWSVVVLGHVLVQSARRVELVGGSQGVSGWLLLLLALPVLWMSWGKCAAFFRGGEIYWMVLVAALVAVGLLAIPQVTVSYLWTRQGSGWTSALMGAGTVAMAAWVLPYLYKVSPRQRQGGPVGRWLLLAGLLGVALAALTRGVLGNAAGELPHPFFVTTGVMGESARLEGLLSALWLICDLVWAGLLARVWGDGKGPVLGVLLGIAVAFTGWTEMLPTIVWPIGNLALAALSALVPRGAEEIVVEGE